MLNSDQIRRWMRQYSILRPFVDAAGTLWPFLAFIGGAAIVALLVGFFKEHPAIAMACAMVIAYYGFLLFERVSAWLRRDTLDHKLELAQVRVSLKERSEESCEVTVHFRIVNHADYDIYYKIDDEDFAVGADHARPEISQVVQIVPARNESGQASTPIETTFPLKAGHAAAKLTLRFGRRKDRLDMRWFVAADAFFDPAQTANKNPAPTGYVLRRNDFEWISP